MQDDWAGLLPLAEFACNNACHSATRFSPFYATYGYHPSLSFSNPTTSTVPATEDRIQHLHEVHEDLKIIIALAREQAKQSYDKGKKVQSTFQIGDKVLLRHDNIPTMTPSQIGL